MTRGLGDSMALRLACHDARIHATHVAAGRRCPGDLRCRRAGARRGDRRAAAWPASPTNLASMLDEKYAKANFRGIDRQADAPLERGGGDDGAREADRRAAARHRRQGARSLARLHRGEGRPATCAACGNVINDQQAFARVIRNMLASMDMAEEIRRRRRSSRRTRTARRTKTSRAARSRTRIAPTRTPAPRPRRPKRTKPPTSRWTRARRTAPKSPKTT